MDKSTDQEEAVIEVGDGDRRTPERRTVRRRLVQSTLFPNMSRDNAKEVEEKQDGDDCDLDEDEDEEYCGSRSRRKRKRKPKTTPQSRESKKKTVNKLVNSNGKDALSGRVNKKDSSICDNSNFFLKASERQSQTKQQEEQQLNDSSPEGNENMGSPQQLNGKQHKNLTPSKKVTTNGLKRPSLRQIPTNPISGEHVSQIIPDLRLEAKLTAEENSRLFAGRQIHPFFSSCKLSKKCQEISEVDNNWCSVERKDNSLMLGPIHVFEMLQDEVLPLDWKSWTFCERTFVSSNCTPSSAFSSSFAGSFELLNIGNLHSVQHLDTALFSENKASVDQYPTEALHWNAWMDSAILADEQGLCYKDPKDMESEHEFNEVVISPGHVGHVDNLTDDHQSRHFEERLASHYIGSSNLPKDILWTERYQPGKAIEVCGNSGSVKFLNEWLHLWHERDSQTIKDSADGNECTAPNNEHDWYESDCDSGNTDGGANLKNVLLVTGPVGSGKSAAIYACAKEQGFKVIEVNSSDWRNGALVKQNFREAVESHRFKWSLKNHVGTWGKHLRDSSPALLNIEAAEDFDNEVIELIPVSDEEETCDAIRTSKKENKTAYGRAEIKSLVLFEDVDIPFIEDRGFVAAIQQLAETAKLPMILTANSNGPVLPENFDRLEVCFTMPSTKELLSHVYMICAAENANISPPLIERFVEYFHGDIRKTITHLQFWCQGKRDTKDQKVQRTYGPLLFDLAAGYQILPKIIPWDLPSQLSEQVLNEIAKPLSSMEENSASMGLVVEEKLGLEGVQNELETDKKEIDSIEAKKKAILSRNCSVYDYDEYQANTGSPCDSSNSSGSPVGFTRRNVRRKLGSVLSFSSVDDFFGEVSIKETNDKKVLDIDCNIPPPLTEHCSNPITEQLLYSDILPISRATQNGLNPLTDPLFLSKSAELQECLHQCSDTAGDLYVNEPCRSLDVSCVPESSFVPETELNDGSELLSRAVSCCHSPDNSVSGELLQDLSAVETGNIDKPLSRLRRGLGRMQKRCDANVEPIHAEEVGDSQIEHVESVARGYQVMDECSRMDFNKKTTKSFEKSGSCMVTESVQETWRKLRGSPTELRKYVASEQKDASQIVKLDFEISNLISDADLLLSNCNFLMRDSLKPSMFPSGESDASTCYIEQLQMTSTLAEHGFCLYIKDILAAGSNISSNRRVDLVSEMLASTTDTMVLGKLLRQEMGTRTLDTLQTSELGLSKCGISSKREMESCLQDIVQSFVPSKACLTLKGDAFYEYLSSLTQISRSATSRISSIGNTKGRRRRAARHYLSSGACALSPEDISLLNECHCYGKFPLR